MGLEKNKIADKQAEYLNQTYRLGWMDGYGHGYDDAVADSEERINELEREKDLLEDELNQEQEKNQKMASHLGKGLRANRG